MDRRHTAERSGERGAHEGQGLVHALFGRLSAARSTRRLVACLECGNARVAGTDAGECPTCGYLGWRELADGVRGNGTLPLLARDAP